MDGRVPVTPTYLKDGSVKKPSPLNTPSAKTPSARTVHTSQPVHTSQSNLKESMLKEFGLSVEKTVLKPSPSQRDNSQRDNIPRDIMPRDSTPNRAPQTAIYSQQSVHSQQPQLPPMPASWTVTQKSRVSYTDEEIAEMLSGGYINIIRDIWEFLPVGSHLRFFKKAGATRNERFRPGGFIKKQYETPEGKKILLMETICNGRADMPDYFTYPMAYDDLSEIWKRYPEECFVEIHLINNSLAKKSKQIADLDARISALEAKNKK